MNIFLLSALVLACCILVLYLVAILSKHHASIDVGYGLIAMTVVVVAYVYAGTYPSARAEIATLLVCVWGMRLFIHLYFAHRKRGEHPRLSTQRSAWKGKGRIYESLRSFFQVFVLQGIFLYILLLPSLLANTPETSTMEWYNWVGVLIWILGFIIQTNTDNRLYMHSSFANNKTILQHGLWKYTRHPNYFGEVLMWSGLALLCLFGVEHSLLAFLSPLYITCYLLYVTIPNSEKLLAHKSGWEAYIRKTSPLFPWFPKQ
jgi:steroid 5-alpha reductase family enzyme